MNSKNTTRCHLYPLKFAYLLWTQMIIIDPYKYIYIYLYELYISLSTTPHPCNIKIPPIISSLTYMFPIKKLGQLIAVNIWPH